MRAFDIEHTLIARKIRQVIQMGNITIRMNDDLKARVNQTLDAIG